MEVVHIVRQYLPSVGGLEDAVQNLCSNLSRREGVKVRVITLDRLFSEPSKKLPQREIIAGIPVTRISYFGSNRYPIALSILNEIKSATIVHVHAIDFFFDFLAFTQFIHHKPLVASTHGGFFHTSFASTLKKIYFQTMTRMSSMAYEKLCASSENDAATFRRIAASKVLTIENGVNIDKWKDKGSFIPMKKMIFIGRWSKNKEVPVLIKLIAALKQAGHEWSLVIAGVPSDETIESLSTLTKQLNIEKYVEIYVKPSENELASLINTCSYIASASIYEGFGISIVEGLSAGLLPIMSQIPPFEKLRTALDMGAIIDSSALTKSVEECEALHAKLRLDPLGVRQKCMLLAQNYDWASVTDRVLDVYKNAINNDYSTQIKETSS